MSTPLSLDAALVAARWAGNLPESTHADVAERLVEVFALGRPVHALSRHLRDVSRALPDGGWEATTQSVEAALDLLAPGEDKLRTAGAILAGNHFAAAMREGASRCPHRLARAAALIRGLWGPRSMPPLGTTALVDMPQTPITAERLDAIWGGTGQTPEPVGRNYVGAGYDPDGNVDAVFMAHVWGPVWNTGTDTMTREELLQSIRDWIDLRYTEATAGRGPQSLRRLVEQMKQIGATETLLDDSKTIAGAAWREVLVDLGEEHFEATDVLNFLDGTSFSEPS